MSLNNFLVGFAPDSLAIFKLELTFFNFFSFLFSIFSFLGIEASQINDKMCCWISRKGVVLSKKGVFMRLKDCNFSKFFRGFTP